jgi:glycosyltransferase involved in cell wall biosynthesis
MQEQNNYNVLSSTEEKTLADAKIAYESNMDSLQLFDKYAQLLIKNNFITQAETLIASASILKKNDAESGTVRAHLLYKLKKYSQADVLFDALLLTYSENQKLRMLYAQTLRKRKKLIQAYYIIQPLDVDNLDKKQRIIYDDITHIVTTVQTKEMRALQNTEDFGILSMKHAILHFKGNSENITPSQLLGKVSLITGTLGPGGAEKQLCLTAIHLNEKRLSGEPISELQINKEVDVLINMLDSDDKAFFLPFLEKNKVSVLQVKTLPSIPIENLAIKSPTLFNLVNESPSSIRYGLTRLVPYFRSAQTDVVFAWQDGAILFTAIAALIADVPKIVLNLRGYPPNLRQHLFKPEYYDFYKALSEVPNVTYVTNTQATASAYADWLNISTEKFTIIYNGIVPPNINPESQDTLIWANFESQTDDASETIGGVFRFETDKRPFLVIRFIKRYLQQCPRARFILVGEGRMRQQCMDLAKELKISHRILCTGLSKSVGYWMSKMDAMVLMSLYEGLPNVLIEAQYMGVPVVSTSAGGAKECFIEGETGYILNDVNEPDLKEACYKVSTLINQFKKYPNLRDKAIHFASTNFSISGMLENTVRALSRNKTTSHLEQPTCKEQL